MNPETIIQNAILAAIGSRDDLYIARRNVGLARDVDTGRVVKFGVTGEADLQGVLRVGRSGLAVALEVKTPTGRQSQTQERWEAAWTRRGGFYRVVRSVADAEQALLDARTAALVEAP
jgi:hypothetical protein